MKISSRRLALRWWLAATISLGWLLAVGLAAAGPTGSSQYGTFQPVTPAQAQALRPAFAEVADIPALPRVLLIGDSISIGYTLAVRAQLAGRANVHRPSENCGSTGYGLERLEAWLGAGPWAVIHFNFGLHDLKYLDAQGNYVAPEQGQQLVPVAEYELNLRKLVQRMQQTGAKIIFATTTPIPAGSAGRVEGSELLYNAAAGRVMRSMKVAVDDLHAHALARQGTIQLPKNVHFTPAGSEELAGLVTQSILSKLTP